MGEVSRILRLLGANVRRLHRWGGVAGRARRASNFFARAKNARRLARGRDPGPVWGLWSKMVIFEPGPVERRILNV